MRVYPDRRSAGAALAEPFSDARFRTSLVMGMARGGVPVAAELARRIHAELGVIVTATMRSAPPLGMAVGATTANGPCHVDAERALSSRAVVAGLGDLRAAAAAAARRFEDRLGPEAAAEPSGRFVILVDEALVWESPALAAVRWARKHGARRVVLAVPTGAPRAIHAVRVEVDAVVCLQTEPGLDDPQTAYLDLPPVLDGDLLDLLRAATRRAECLGPILWSRITIGRGSFGRVV